MQRGVRPAAGRPIASLSCAVGSGSSPPVLIAAFANDVGNVRAAAGRRWPALCCATPAAPTASALAKEQQLRAAAWRRIRQTRPCKLGGYAAPFRAHTGHERYVRSLRFDFSAPNATRSARRARLEQLLDDRQRERERLAGAGARAANEVLAVTRRLEHVLLDGEERGDAARLQRPDRHVRQPAVGQLRAWLGLG